MKRRKVTRAKNVIQVLQNVEIEITKKKNEVKPRVSVEIDDKAVNVVNM